MRRPRLSAFAVWNGIVFAGRRRWPVPRSTWWRVVQHRALVLAGEVVFWPRGFNTASYAWVLVQGGFWTSMWCRAAHGSRIVINVVLVLLLAFPLPRETEFRARTLTCGSSSSPCCSRAG